MYLDSAFLCGVASSLQSNTDSQSMKSDGQGRLYTSLKDRIKHED